ncbi:MAG: OB-fold nucleic acid binding domain-containing protein [Candidatus Nanoarchaeia archaeon]
MIHIPLANIISRIREKTNLPDEEINALIDQKLTALSGLVSREGAAHIVANELGIKLFEQSYGKLQIANILAGMRSVEAVGKVQQVSEIKKFQARGREGQVASLLIADHSGSIRVVLWGEHANKSMIIKEGDIVKVTNSYVRENQGRKEIHLNDRSQIIINPPGESVEISTEGHQKQISQLKEGDENIQLTATIVQAFEPHFFEVCPQCGKRLQEMQCQSHGAVAPDWAYVMNLFIDDGTDSIRAVLFRQQVSELLGLEKEQMLHYKDSIQDFQEINTKLSGTQIKVHGRVTKNKIFDRNEFIVQKIEVLQKPEQHSEITNITEVENVS